MPNGTFTRLLSTTLRKLTNIPCAVSGRRNALLSSLCIAPMCVSNIRLNSRGSVSVPSSFASGASTWSVSVTVVRSATSLCHVNWSAYLDFSLKC